MKPNDPSKLPNKMRTEGMDCEFPESAIPIRPALGDPRSRDPQRRSLGGRLAGLSLPRQVLVLAIWPLLEQFMSYLVGTVDLSLAGHLPESLQVPATDALGVTGYVGWLMAMVHSGVGIGGTGLIARATGARHRGLANAVVGQCLVLAVVSGVLVGSVIILSAGTIGRVAGLSGSSLEMCQQYLWIVAGVSPFSAILLIGNACLRGAGDTRTPFVVMLVVNAVNIVTSIFLVFGPAPFGGNGVLGIAMGTGLAWVCGSVLIVTSLLRDWGGLRLHFHRLRPHAHTMRRIVRIGGPNLLESVVGMWLGNFLVLRIVGKHMGFEGAIGAHMIAIRVESISFLSGFALSVAAATLTGQYLGLGDVDRARKVAWISWGMGGGIMGIFGVFFMVTPETFAHLITDSRVLLDHSVPLIQICGPIQVFFAMYLVFSGALRGAGDTRVSMWMTTLLTFLVRVPAAYAMGVYFGLGLTGIWLALCGELVLRGIVFAGRFWHGGWAKIEV